MGYKHGRVCSRGRLFQEAARRSLGALHTLTGSCVCLLRNQGPAVLCLFYFLCELSKFMVPFYMYILYHVITCVCVYMYMLNLDSLLSEPSGLLNFPFHQESQ